MELSTIPNSVSIFLSFIVVGLLFGCIFSYWRNAHGMAGQPDMITMKYGIYGNCKDTLANVTDVCVVPQNEGFVGDFAILLMLIISLLLFAIHIPLTCLALSTLNINQILLYVLPVPSIIANFLMVSCCGIFADYTNTVYKDDIVVQSPLKITYGEGFYVLIVAICFGTFAMFFSEIAAFAMYDEMKEIKAQKTGYVVQQKVVKKHVIETPEVEYEEVEEEQPQQQVAEEDEDVESAKIVRKHVKKAKKVQKAQRKSKLSINAPVKKKKKIQSGSQQSEVVKGDDESKKSKSEKPLSSLKSVSGMKVEVGSDRSRGKKRTNIEESE